MSASDRRPERERDRMSPSGLVGRDREVRVLEELILKGRAYGQALVVIGEPGIGKSALLAAAEAAALGQA